MHSDQRQPGWKMKRPTSVVPSRTTLISVFSSFD
jgi:hypothetical protein